MLVNLIGALQRTPIYAEGMIRSCSAAFGRTPALMFTLIAEGVDFFVVQIAALTANSVLMHGGGMMLVGILGANAVGLTCYFSFRSCGLYEIGVMLDDAQVIKAIFIRWSILCLLLAASAVLLHHNGDRGRLWLFLFYSVGLTGFFSERFILSLILKFWLRKDNYIHAVGIVGSGEPAQHVAALLRSNTAGLRFAGMFDSEHAAGNARARRIEELLELAQKDGIDTVIIAEPDVPVERLRVLVQRLRQQPLSIYLMPNALALESSACRWPGNHVLPGVGLFPLAERPINEMSLFLKSIFDRLTALLLIIVLLPVLAACAVGIRCSDPGPVLFCQKRIGYKGREFMIFKFRTMYVSEEPNVKLTERNDRRIFGFGTLLRKTSLDELPQLFNVLRGEMSLVGPRPHMPLATAAGHLYYEAVSDYAARHRVKPGITGWAQVNGWRGPTETIDQIKSRVTHDIYYIENWSIFLDFRIMLKTVFVLFGKDVF
ncbi:MAG: exopolysaccharide biosynthesis polyprenyl glycosylphosphotransferase [Rhodospirillales bacterium]|nr:exopolysaccharide biosynthesis polyprenyl glycosylphosphotransferase [Rhodospirillales bacterium]